MMKPNYSSLKRNTSQGKRKCILSVLSILFASLVRITIGWVGAYSYAQEPPRTGATPEIRRAIPIESTPNESKRGVQSSATGSVGGASLSERRATAPLKLQRASAPLDDVGSKEQSPNTMAGLNDKRVISIGDKISLNIVEDETAPRSLSVTDSGEIDVPYIGRVAVGGRTCKQLAQYVKKLLEREYYYEATVLISLDSAGARSVSRGRFYLSGQVLRPSQYELPIEEVLTVSKAILRAGGFTQYANKKKVRLMRSGASKEKLETIVIDVNAILEKGDAVKDVEIQPEDSIFVDEKFFNFK